MFRLLIVGGEIFPRVKAVCDVKVLLDFSFQSLIVLDVLQTSKYFIWTLFRLWELEGPELKIFLLFFFPLGKVWFGFGFGFFTKRLNIEQAASADKWNIYLIVNFQLRIN